MGSNEGGGGGGQVVARSHDEEGVASNISDFLCASCVIALFSMSDFFLGETRLSSTCDSGSLCLVGLS